MWREKTKARKELRRWVRAERGAPEKLNTKERTGRGERNRKGQRNMKRGIEN